MILNGWRITSLSLIEFHRLNIYHLHPFSTRSLNKTPDVLFIHQLEAKDAEITQLNYVYNEFVLKNEGMEGLGMT